MTLRELLYLAEGHGRDRWGRTAAICALIANAHRDPKKGRPFKPGDFDPYERETREVIEVTSETIGTFRDAFLRKQGRKGF